MNKNSNYLTSEKSPYLLQHAHNPVHWYPWSEAVFKNAKEEDKPIFLSIGYSTCHWCHVMEKESFEDIEVARLMNETFVSIKVDREERPDIEKAPEAYTQFISSFDFMLGPSFEIVVVGDINSDETKNLLKALNSKFIPNKVVILKTIDSPENEITETPDFIKDLKMINNKSTIYICSNFSCKLPTNDINEMLKLLN